MKKVRAVKSAGRTQLAPNGVVDEVDAHTVVVRELLDGLACAVALHDDIDAHPLARESGPTETERGVDDDGPRLVIPRRADKGEEPNGEALRVPVHPAKTRREGEEGYGFLLAGEAGVRPVDERRLDTHHAASTTSGSGRPNWGSSAGARAPWTWSVTALLRSRTSAFNHRGMR